MAEKSVIIFGGVGGIGGALAERLAGAGWRVAVTSRELEKAREAAGALDGLGLSADVNEARAVDEAVAAAAKEFGGLYAAVNCVGSILIKPAHLTTDDEWERTMALNLTSSFRIMRAAIKAMRNGPGAIALCSSAAAQTGIANHEAIAAAKAGVIGLARSAAATYAARGIRVNAVAPGLVDTPMAKAITGNERSRDFSLKMHPLGRLGTSEDVASALAWLIDPENSWVTGQVLGVEGGLASLKTA